MSKPELPEIVPLFPLTGVLLLPGMWLPLHVFEPRYRAMVVDAREGGKQIALVQPLVPMQDNAPPPAAPSDAQAEPPPEHPTVYTVGCVGRMERCEESEDGRFVIALRGVSRFRLHEELPLLKGYRRAVATYEEFTSDVDEPKVDFEPTPLLDALKHYNERNRLPFDLAKLSTVPGIALLNGLCMSLPFAAAEKQALLEAATPGARERLLLGLMGMGIDSKSDEERHIPPTLN